MSHINKALVQKTLAMVLAAATAPAVASVSAEQIQALEVRLAQLEADKALSSASDLSGMGLSDRLKINGFMSAGATYLMDDSYPGANDGTLPFPANTLNKLVDGDQQSVTLGLRYDFLPKASVKFDVSAVIDTGDAWGAATPLDSNGNGTNIDEQLFGKPDTPFYLYRLMLDVVF